MDLEEVEDKEEYYFVFYCQSYDYAVEVYNDPEDVEKFITKKKADKTFQVICIVKGSLVDIKPTQVKTCWKIQE